MNKRSAIKILRKVNGYKYPAKAPGYRWSTAWRALNIWGKAIARNPDKTPKTY